MTNEFVPTVGLDENRIQGIFPHPRTTIAYTFFAYPSNGRSDLERSQTRDSNPRDALEYPFTKS